MSDWEISDIECPKCGKSYTRQRHCNVVHCEEGYIDEHNDDPINFMPGESEYRCGECAGTGIERWCGECGYDLQRKEYINGQPATG